MFRVLVSGAGGDIAQGVIKCLMSSSLDLDIHKISSSENDSWLYVDEKSYISPTIYDNYVSYLIRFINKYDIDIFFPCIDLEMPIIAANKGLIEKNTKCVVFVGSLEKVNICNDKYKTAIFLKQQQLTYPHTSIATNMDNIMLPMIIKTREGYGSRDVHFISNKEQILPSMKTDKYIVQEYLEGQEYTAGVYLGEDRLIKGTCIFKRQLKNGSTYTAERIINKKYEKTIAKIASSLGLKYLNIQFRIKNEDVCPFELNGRFSGTTGIISKVFNAPEMAIRELIMKEKIRPVVNNEIFYVMRYYEEIYASKEQRKNLTNRSAGQKT